MGRREQYRVSLAGTAGRIAYLRGHSGLPGARANIELARAAAAIGEPAWLDELIATDEEYLVFCGVLGLDDPSRLREQALGYCWSVAVAADPAAGLPLFQRLSEVDDPDVAWIVRENSKKARLRSLLP